MWVLRKGRTYGRSGKLVASCSANLNSSDETLPAANDRTSARTRSPISALVSWPNCTRAPRKRRIFCRTRTVSCCAARLGTCTDDGSCCCCCCCSCCDDGGLIEPLGGEVLPLPDIRSSCAVVEPPPPPPAPPLPLVSCAVGIGEMGECASGDSGVLHPSRSFVSAKGESKEEFAF